MLNEAKRPSRAENSENPVKDYQQKNQQKGLEIWEDSGRFIS